MAGPPGVTSNIELIDPRQSSTRGALSTVSVVTNQDEAASQLELFLDSQLPRILQLEEGIMQQLHMVLAARDSELLDSLATVYNETAIRDFVRSLCSASGAEKDQMIALCRQGLEEQMSHRSPDVYTKVFEYARSALCAITQDVRFLPKWEQLMVDFVKNKYLCDKAMSLFNSDVCPEQYQLLSLLSSLFYLCECREVQKVLGRRDISATIERYTNLPRACTAYLLYTEYSGSIPEILRGLKAISPLFMDYIFQIVERLHRQSELIRKLTQLPGEILLELKGLLESRDRELQRGYFEVNGSHQTIREVAKLLQPPINHLFESALLSSVELLTARS
jgi:hypothetical protein